MHYFAILAAGFATVALANPLTRQASSCNEQNPVYNPLARCYAQYQDVEDKQLVLARLVEYYDEMEQDSGGLIGGLLDTLLGSQGPNTPDLSPVCRCNLLACAKYTQEARSACLEESPKSITKPKCDKAIQDCSDFIVPVFVEDLTFCC